MNIKHNNKGSLTLEACIVVPVFIGLMLLVNGLFVMFMGQQIISHTLVQSAKSLSFDCYSTQRVTDDKNNQLAAMFTDIFTIGHGNNISTEKWYEDADKVKVIAKERFLAYLKSSNSDANELLELVGVENGMNGLDFSESTIDNGRGILTIKLNYTQNYIYNAMGLASFKRSIYVKVKLFEYKEI